MDDEEVVLTAMLIIKKEITSADGGKSTAEVLLCLLTLDGSKMRISMQLFNGNLLLYKFNC